MPAILYRTESGIIRVSHKKKEKGPKQMSHTPLKHPVQLQIETEEELLYLRAAMRLTKGHVYSYLYHNQQSTLDSATEEHFVQIFGKVDHNLFYRVDKVLVNLDIHRNMPHTEKPPTTFIVDTKEGGDWYTRAVTITADSVTIGCNKLDNLQVDKLIEAYKKHHSK